MYDTHAHLNFKAFSDDWRDVVEQSQIAGVKKIIVVGTDVATSLRVLEMVEAYDCLYGAVGIHPHHAQKYLSEDEGCLDEELTTIAQLAKHPKIVAIGEIGLDHHYYKKSKYGDNQHDESYWIALMEMQSRVLKRQLEIASGIEKPVILHSREVKDQVLNNAAVFKLKGVFHCFDGSKKYAKRITEAGFYISFTGNITFIPDRLEVAATIPLNKLLLETDCPYMTPVPHTGERNLPKNVTIIASAHAESRNISQQEILDQTSKNADRLFAW